MNVQISGHDVPTLHFDSIDAAMAYLNQEIRNMVNAHEPEASPTELRKRRVEALLDDPDTQIDVGIVFDILEEISWTTADIKGFHDEPRTFGEEVALMHSELSEALEAARTGADSDKLDDFTGVEEELADLIIRVFDSARERGLDLANAMLTKMAYNLTRPYKHGKAF